MEVASVLELLEHSVLAMTLDDIPLVEMSVLDPLEHSGLGVTDNVDVDSGPLEVTSHLAPLEHSVLDTALDGGITKGDGGPDRGLTFLSSSSVSGR